MIKMGRLITFLQQPTTNDGFLKSRMYGFVTFSLGSVDLG